MLITATLSKPVSNIEELLGKPYQKVKIKAEATAAGAAYYVEMFTQKQVFHKHMSESEALNYIEENLGKTFKNCVQRTESEEITLLSNKKGKITRLVKKLDNQKSQLGQQGGSDYNNLQKLIKGSQKTKKYLLPEGTPVPFLVLLGVMTDEGKVIASKYDKFRQINRFLEFIDDVIGEVEYSEENPVRIADFGCGKSYLTFAVHYFLTEVKHIPCQIEGLDLKKDVIDYCNEITAKLGLENLVFHIGNIADYSGKENPDIVITLHACDTATDYALQYAVEHSAKVILSVPCCQHQINTQLSKEKPDSPEFAPLLKYGLIRERFSSLVTDALRGQWLEARGYKVQMLEFIDIEHTPKNILIRAVAGKCGDGKAVSGGGKSLIEALQIQPELFKF